MFAYILVGLGFLLLLIGAIVIFLSISKRRSIGRASLNCFVDLYPSGKSNVEFIPVEYSSEIKLIKLSLLYAIKIRHLVQSQPLEIFETYKTLIERITSDIGLAPGEFAESLADLTDALENRNDRPTVTAKGERFLIFLIEGAKNDWIHFELPFRFSPVNLPISVVIVAKAVAEQLTGRNKEIFENQFKYYANEMFKSEKINFAQLNYAIRISLDLEKRSSN